jgi:nitroreductase
LKEITVSTVTAPRRTKLTSDVVASLIATATRAPSVHNTQPWVFEFADDAIELRADPARGLRVADPSARELIISCGAALATLELAIRGLSLQPRTHLLPDPENPRLLARVRGVPGSPPTKEERRLLHAISRRHTHRAEFDGPAPSAHLIDRLRTAALRYGAHLRVISDAVEIERTLELAWAADKTQRDDITWRAEMARWANKPGVTARDGVPTFAFPAQRQAAAADVLPGREFALGRRSGTGAPAGYGPSALCVLVTDGEGPRHWLRAGAALQYILLTAASNWFFANFATQPLELPETRRALRDAISEPGQVQMLFQLGYSHTAFVTPRRPVREVLGGTTEPSS